MEINKNIWGQFEPEIDEEVGRRDSEQQEEEEQEKEQEVEGYCKESQFS